MAKRRALELLLLLICPLLALGVWLSALSFVPVPWPDDSAFYFVAKSFFAWPPRWVMLPQAPFEPTYRIFNFNTMPLYPFLLGLGRLVGIDGSHAIKFWPLSFFAASGSVLAVAVYRAGLPWLLSALVALAIGLDPELHWASVLVRPESLIGLIGVLLVTGFYLGWWNRTSTLWDPVAFLLAIGAYAHFNAVHLVYPVIAAFLLNWKRVFQIGWKTALYLSPWAVTVVMKWGLFQHQMLTQWRRLAVPNSWLGTVGSAVGGLFQALGSPEPWPDSLVFASILLWILIFVAAGFALWGFGATVREKNAKLFPAAVWVFSALWLWQTKPEVWFVYYIHIAILTFAGLLALDLWRRPSPIVRYGALAPLAALLACFSGITAQANAAQAIRLGSTQTWHWETYHSFIDCIDARLSKLENDLGHPKPFRVWDPTFPDITIELSRRHPDWDLTRTNDFAERWKQAVRHGHEVDAVVIPETLNWPERDLNEPLTGTRIESVWMNWRGYFLNSLYIDKNWKPNRYYCQKGRWQAFIFMN